MGRPNESVEEDVADPPGIDLQNKRRRSRRRAWRDGLADQTVVHALEDVRCYRAFERAALIHDPCWSLRGARTMVELPHHRAMCPAPFPTLTRPCSAGWAAVRRDYCVKRRKRFGRLRRCDSRRLQCGSDCATGPRRPSPGIGRGRFRLTYNLGVERSADEGLHPRWFTA
jgi:hypothetical protein